MRGYRRDYEIPSAGNEPSLMPAETPPSTNPRVRVKDVRLLSDDWYRLHSTTFEIQGPDGAWTTQSRETYDRGNGATILLYDVARRTVLLTSQFRYPAYINGHPDGVLLETAAGLLDDDDPETAIRREAIEETGHRVGEVTHVFDAYMSPGSVTERVHFYAAPYDAETREHDGGGLAHEGEHITLVELDIDAALELVESGGIIDGKTIMLLQWAVLRGPFAS
jgi:nudix-type nucleoside diphosphatase (YffH/AdpP family)